ncbi:RHS repeat-associated core domain-containing protein [Planctomycetota bacterium]
MENPFRFAGYWWDDEIKQYYCRARQYDPQLQRFTSIDPVRGKFQEPMTLHQYLYCLNNPVNRWDPDGLMSDTAVALPVRAALTAFWMQSAEAAMAIGLKAAVKLVAVTMAAYIMTETAIEMVDYYQFSNKLYRKHKRRIMKDIIGRGKGIFSKGPGDLFPEGGAPGLGWKILVGIAIYESLKSGCDTEMWEELPDLQENLNPNTHPTIEEDR